MKTKLFFLLAFAVLVFSSCDKEKFEVGSKAIVKPASLSSNKASDAMRAASTTYEVALNVVKKSDYMLYKMPIPEWNYAIANCTHAIFKDQKDTISEVPTIALPTTLFYANNTFLEVWCNTTDVIFADFLYNYYDSGKGYVDIYDTLAYIPNAVMQATGETLLKAVQDEDAVTCKKILSDGYKFIPITGAEWRALKKAGQN